MDLLQSSYKPNFFIRSRKKNACPRPNAVDGSLIYKGDDDNPIHRQQSNSNIRFPHGTEVRFDCLRTEEEEEEEEEQEIAEGAVETELVAVADAAKQFTNEGEDGIVRQGGKRRKRGAAGRNIKKSKKKKTSKINTRRRGGGMTGGSSRNQFGDGDMDAAGDIAGAGIGKRVKYRSWKIVCNDGRWIGMSLGCDDNGQPILDDEAASAVTGGVDYNPFNASCPYLGTAESNLVAFYGDREVKKNTIERFEPGAELVFRCTDIGRCIYSIDLIFIIQILLMLYGCYYCCC